MHQIDCPCATMQDLTDPCPPHAVTSTKPPEKQPAEKKVTRGSAAAAVEAPATRTSQRASTKQPAPAAAAPAAKGKTPGRSAGTSRKTKREAGPQFLASFELNGETYAVGDDVYIIETDTPSELPHDEEHDLCCVCGGSNTKGMIECMRCLGGFHMRCLKPALKKVPEVSDRHTGSGMAGQGFFMQGAGWSCGCGQSTQAQS